MQAKITILCTGAIRKSFIEEAKTKGVEVDAVSFIEIKAVCSQQIQQEIDRILHQEATIVFTSMNAVETVAGNVPEVPPAWQIYSVGNTTRKLIQKYYGKDSIAGTADNASALASTIIERGDVEEVFFFCGNNRMNELPDALRESGIDVNEVVVYKTIVLPHKLEKQYHGIVFFSPSAVESFFQNNTPSQQTILFAIGNTTANVIKKYSGNKLIISNEPGKEKLVGIAIDFFCERG